MDTDIVIQNANIQVDKTTLLTKYVKMISTTINTIAEVLTQKCKLYFRNTGEQDQVNAGSLVRTVKQEYRLTAGYGSISVKHHLSVDGKKVMFN